MISPKDSHFLDHFSPQEDDELPPLESVEPEPVLGGGTFLMGIYGYGMEMLWKTHHLLDIFFGISFGMFFFGIFLGYGKHILQRIYIYIFQHVFGPFFLETSTMIRLANPRSDDPETPWLEQARNDPEMLS